MPEYEKDTLYRPETKKSGSLAYKIGQAIAILMSLCASAIIVAATIKLIRNFAIAKKLREKLHRQNLFMKLVASLNRHGSIKSDISERRKET